VVEDRRLGMEEDIPVRLDGNEMVVVVVAAGVAAVDPIVAMTTAEEDTTEANVETIIVAAIEEVGAEVAGTGVKVCFVHRCRQASPVAIPDHSTATLGRESPSKAVKRKESK
jgi:hypothetical protein